MTKESAPARDHNDAVVIPGSGLSEHAEAHGHYEIECIGSDGELKWRDVIANVVTIPGKNLALDSFLAGSGYTTVGPYMGLISSIAFSNVDANDTMSAHAGWVEAGGAITPNYTGNRRTTIWASAGSGSKSLSAVLAFPITSNGVIKGAFLCLGSGATAVKDSNTGTLWSAGTFATGDKPVVNGDVLNVNYTASL